MTIEDYLITRNLIDEEVKSILFGELRLYKHDPGHLVTADAEQRINSALRIYDYLVSIYENRVRISHDRQLQNLPEIKDFFSVLQSFLAQNNLRQPFRMPIKHLDAFRRYSKDILEDAVQSVPAQANIDPARPHFYRLSGLYKMRNGCDLWHNGRRLAPPGGNITPDIYTIYDLLVAHSRRSVHQGWLPLRDYAKGNLSSNEQVTWWTTFPISEHDIIKAKRMLGMTQEYVPEPRVLLRCDAADIHSGPGAFVPNAVNAFTNLIFETKPTVPGPPPSGDSISLLDWPYDLVVGDTEFIMGPIPIESIWLRPLPPTSDPSCNMSGMKEVEQSEEFMQSLNLYYQQGIV